MRGSFDFETYGGFNTKQKEDIVYPLCCGVMWGPKGARTSTLIHDRTHSNPDSVAEKFLRMTLDISDVDYWYGHNMGRFDGLFLSAAAHRMGWEQTAVLAGGNRAIEWRFRPPDSKRWVITRDSFALVPSRLKDAAKDFELPGSKLFEASDYRGDMRLLPVSRLKKGCLRDCELVLDLLDVLEGLIENWGGELSMTFSSSALSIIKAKLAEQDLALPSFDGIQEVNAIGQRAYKGGRVEVINHLPQGWQEETDINSSYPRAMLEVMPWEFEESLCGREAVLAFNEGREGVFKACVSVPLDSFIPPLPYKLPCETCFKNGTRDCEHKRTSPMFFPVGEWEDWFPGNELRYAIECGVDVTIREAQIYTSREPFKEFIQAVYQLKQTSKGAVRTFAKLTLNGAYGKFGQKPEQSTLRVFHTLDEMRNFAWDNPGRASTISETSLALAVSSFRWPAHTNYAVASYITAYSRIYLHRFMMVVKRPAYVDTDAVHCEFEGMPKKYLSSELGALKLEIPRFKGTYYAPKIYKLEIANESGAIVDTHYAAKGFSVKCDACRTEDPELECTCNHNFDEIVTGEVLVRGRMQLGKSQLRRAPSVTKFVTDNKTWKGFSNKRYPFNNGETRPWTVGELGRGRFKEVVSPAFKKRNHHGK